MKTKFLLIFIATNFLIVGSAVLVKAGIADIQYPVKELGNCQDESACKLYCDKPENIEVCVDFAEENNLMSKEEIDMAKKFIAAGGEGPGGCKTKDACDEYCGEISHIDECITFAEENGLISDEELEEAKKVQAAIKRGIQPPPCGGKKACDVYCDDPTHMEECITFAEAAGFLEGKEFEDAQKMIAAIKRGVQPPPCRGKEACDEYCGDPNNLEVCVTFATEAGFMTEEEKADAQKMLEAVKKGVKPPNCRGKEQCDVYCTEEEHFEECLNFAEAVGFMNAKEVAMARKTGGKGPGGCRGKEECESFCNDPANQETCFNFAKENGLISEEDLKQMEEGKQKFMESLQNMPPEVYSCLESLVGSETMAKYKSGEAIPTQEIGDKMKECFEKNMQQGQPGNVAPGTTGPGGCTSPEECQKYCESNPEDCQNFQSSIYDESKGGLAPVIPQGPSQEEIDRMMQEEAQRKAQQMIEEEQQRRMQEERDRMMEQQAPPPTEIAPPPTEAAPPPSEAVPPPTEIAPPPGETFPPPEPLSSFEAVKNFLAGLIPKI